MLAKDGKYVLQQAGRALDWQVATVPVRDNLGNVWNIARSTADALGTARYTLIEGFETETGEVLLRTATRSGDEVVVAGKRINSLLERIKAKLRIAPHEWSTADIDRFVDDFIDNTDALAKFESGALDVEVWRRFSTISHEIRRNADFLNRFSKLSVDKQANMLEFMVNQKKPAGFNTPFNRVNFDATKNDIDIGDGVSKSYTVHYDENGFPDFRDLCPDKKFIYKPDIQNEYPVLTGKNSDIHNGKWFWD